MKYAIYRSLVLLVLPVMVGCSVSNASLTKKDIQSTASAVNMPSGTVGCISPSIVNEDGECAEPKKLSFQ